MSASVFIREVSGKRDLQSFIDFPASLYRDDPNWVRPLDLEQKETLSPKKNPWFEHAEMAMFIAERDGKTVGRVSAQVCQLVRKYHGEGLGQFGFFESIDDPSVARDLFSAAESWLRARGVKRATGPFNPSINAEMGLLIDGFDTPPCLMMGHHKPYYSALLESLGYAKEKDVFAYRMAIDIKLPPVVERLIASVEKNPKLSIRPIDKKNFERDVHLVFDIFNDAWSDNWGFVPFTEKELSHTANMLKLLMREELAYIAFYEGEAAAFQITLPDVNDWIGDLDGKLLPFGWARLASRLLFKDPMRMRVPLMGVRKKFQNRPIGAALAFWVIESCRNNALGWGAQFGELSWILEDNLGMRNMLEQITAEIYKTYRVYAKDIA